MKEKGFDKSYCELIKCHAYDEKTKTMRAWNCCNLPCTAKYSADKFADSKLAARDKEWVEWIERTFYPSANWSDFDNEVWKARKKEIGL